MITAEYFCNFPTSHYHMSDLLYPSISDIILTSQWYILLVIDCTIWCYSIMYATQSKFHIWIEHFKMLWVSICLFTALCQMEGQIASSYSISGQFESNSQSVNIERLFALFWFVLDYKKHIHILLKKVFCCSRLPSPISRLSRIGFW